MQKFIQIHFPVNIDIEENLVQEIITKLEELKQVAYARNNDDLVQVINSIGIGSTQGSTYNEQTYFTKDNS